MKVLIADDDSVSRTLLSRLLMKDGYEVAIATNGLEAWEILCSAGAPRIALLDWMMPGMEGPKICQQVRKRSDGPYIYVLLLTAKDATPDLIEAFESGADDYLTKPLKPEELKARLRAGLRILRLEDDLVAAREEMQVKATHDALTGLWNRAAILEMLQRETSRSWREGNSVTVLLCDLDHFKSVNDAHGHAVGDDVLRETAKRLLASVREYDAVGRYGGEEFLILLPGCPAAKTLERAEKLRAAFSSRPFNTSAGPLRVTLSVGAAATADWKSASIEELIRNADLALYRAKNGGRNRVELALPAKVARQESSEGTTLQNAPGRVQ